MKKLILLSLLIVGCSTEPETQEVSVKISRADTFINGFSININGEDIYKATECACDVETEYVGEPNETDCILNDGKWDVYEDNNYGAEECVEFTDYWPATGYGYGYEYKFSAKEGDNITLQVSGNNTCATNANVIGYLYINNSLVASDTTYCDEGAFGCMCAPLPVRNW